MAHVGLDFILVLVTILVCYLTCPFVRRAFIWFVSSHQMQKMDSDALVKGLNDTRD